ncbi:DUF4395 domain-containing protein [Cypionkella sp. TWP1-2-1b2]|uniref:DUF4395 domain-containing protein n=1 Tax=Cypionkella sp. TWP1-2-1b2 TaxID=2804675 RepID=UPI003CED1439
MKRIPVAAIAVIVLWFGLSTVWMAGTGATQDGTLAAQPQTGEAQPKSCAMMASMRGGADGTGSAMPGGGNGSPQQSMMQGADEGTSAGLLRGASMSGIMTEPVAPILELQDLFATPPAESDVLTRLQAVEDRLAAALVRLEAVGAANVAVTTDAGNQPGPLWVSQLLSVIASGPVIGFLLILSLALFTTTRGRSVFDGASRWLLQSSKVQATWQAAKGPQVHLAVKRKQDQALTYLKSTGLGNPQGRSAQWTRVSAQADKLKHAIVTQCRPFLVRAGLLRQNTSPDESDTFTEGARVYGEVIRGADANGQPLQAGVFEEGQVRAAAGLTLALGAVAFTYAYFAHIYAPIQIVTTLFFLEFLIRIMAGINYSPVGMLAHWMTRRQPPQWVSAKPKRFAWTLGLVMSLAMMIITNTGIRGPLPLTICLICLTLMWLEAVLGLCLGCEIHRYLVRRGWAERDEAYEICANGACDVETRTYHKG